MNSYLNDPRPPMTRWSEFAVSTNARRLILLVGLCLLSAVGCSPSSDSEGNQVELSVGIPAGGSDPGALADGQIDAPSLRTLKTADGNTQLAHYEAPADNKARHQWKLERLHRAINPPKLSQHSLVQRPGKPELVPTPNAKRDAEVVPTPEGYPDGPIEYTAWEKPDVTLVVTGQQHGYIEPCGCTGLDRQELSN